MRAALKLQSIPAIILEHAFCFPSDRMFSDEIIDVSRTSEAMFLFLSQPNIRYLSTHVDISLHERQYRYIG